MATESLGKYKGVEINADKNDQTAIQNKMKEIDTQTINSTALTPTTPIRPADVPQSTNTPALQGTIEEQAKQYTDTVVSDKALTEAKTARDDSLAKLTERITGSKGKTTLTDEYYTKEVDPAKKELNDINNQILQEQNSLRRRVESIEKNNRGATAEGIAQEVRMATKESLATQADLSIIQLAKQNNYFGAKEIADRKVAAQLEDDAQELKVLEFTYLENKELFTKAEQRQFETQQAERTRLLQKEANDLKAVNDFAIEALRNGAPVDAVRRIQGAKTLDEAIGIGGAYLRPAPKAVPTQIIDLNGRKVLINSSTGEIIKEIGGGTGDNSLELMGAENNINTINDVINSSALDSTVGTNALARTKPGFWNAAKRFISGALAGGAAGAAAGLPFAGVGAIPGAIIGALTTGTVRALQGTKDELTGDRQNFIGSVEQLSTQLSLDKLIQAKAEGAAFGALSDSELLLLSKAASKLSTWAIKDSTGKVIGYDAAEKDFKAEMDKINNFAKLDYVLSGGNPTSVGIQITPDGGYWVQNSDGTLTRLR